MSSYSRDQCYVKLASNQNLMQNIKLYKKVKNWWLDDIRKTIPNSYHLIVDLPFILFCISCWPTLNDTDLVIARWLEMVGLAGWLNWVAMTMSSGLRCRYHTLDFLCPSGIHADGHRRSLASGCPTFRKTMLGVVSWRCSSLEESAIQRFKLSGKGSNLGMLLSKKSITTEY